MSSAPNHSLLRLPPPAALLCQTRTVEAIKPGSKCVPMFVQFVLRNVWAVYEASVTAHKPKRLQKMAAALGIDVPDKELAQRVRGWVMVWRVRGGR